MKFPLTFAFGSLGWIGVTGFVSVFGFGASGTTACLICGSLTLLFALCAFYLAWEIRRAELVERLPHPVRRSPRPRPIPAVQGIRLFDSLKPASRLRPHAQSAAPRRTPDPAVHH